MNAFDEALDRFHREGSFIYQDACLSVDRLERLKASLVDLDRSNAYQFHLSNVRLDPQANQVAPVLRRQSTRTSRSNSSSSSEGASGSSNGAISSRDVVWAERLEQFQQPVQAQIEAELTRSRDKFEKELLGVLKSGFSWHSIKIECVYFKQGTEKKYYLSAGFHRTLLSYLTRHDSLITLSLDPFCLSEGSILLGNFLTGNVNLQDLSLSITAGEPADWEDLGLKLAKHPGLIQANFENTALSNVNCSGLLTLAENNYKTNIILPALRLQDEMYLNIDLRKEYQALTERFLRNTPEQRFIQERLSEAGILDLVTSALYKLKSAQKTTYSSSLRDSAEPKVKMAEGALRVLGRLIDATVNEAQAADRSLERNPSRGVKENQKRKARNLFAYLIRTENSPATLNSGEVYQVLPKVYQDNWDYLENNLSSLKLNLKNPHPDKNQSIADFLLDKAYEINDAKALQQLVNAGADIYGLTTGVQQGFFLKVFRNNDQDSLPLREVLLAHIIQDGEAMEKIEKDLKDIYPTLIALYKALDEHLKRYAKILQNRMDVTNSVSQFIVTLKSIMVLVWKEDTAAKRPEELAAIRGHFQQSIVSIFINQDKIRPGSDEFEAARNCFEKIKKISEKAKPGKFWSSNLHGGLLEILTAIQNELCVIQNKFNNLYKGEADEYKGKYESVAKEQTELKEKLSQTESRYKEKVSEMKKEMQAQQVRVQEEQARVQEEQARVQEEQARVQEEQARVQEEQARVQEERARLQEERAEMERRVEARMRELERLFRAGVELPQNQATTPDNETAGSSTQFFAGRR
jgi:hypothetical protein